MLVIAHAQRGEYKIRVAVRARAVPQKSNTRKTATTVPLSTGSEGERETTVYGLHCQLSGEMTFPKWRSYGYKPLESRHKRRNTIGGIRLSGKTIDSAAALSLSGSLTRSRDEGTKQSRLENGTSYAPPSSHTSTTDDTFSPPECDEHPPPPHGQEDVTVSRTTHPTTSISNRGGVGGRRARRSLSVPGWTASLLRSRLSLRRRPSGSHQLRASLSPTPEREESASPNAAEQPAKEQEGAEENDSSGSAPETAADAELEAVLQDAWSSIVAVGEVPYSGFLRRKQALEYSRKMAELRQQYQLKLAEIHQREATFAREFLSHDESTPLLRADELTAPIELQRAIRDTQISGRFDKLRLELKRETAASVLALRARYPSLMVRLRDESRGKARRPRSCQWPAASLVYCNPHCDIVQQSGSMVGIYDGFYATENYSNHESLCLSDSKTEENEY